MLNFAEFSEQRIAEQLAPFWFDHVTANADLTPFENAKKHYFDGLNPMAMHESNVDDSLQFCYPEDSPQKALFGVAQNGGLVVLYNYDLVWFREPDGSEFWARMS